MIGSGPSPLPIGGPRRSLLADCMAELAACGFADARRAILTLLSDISAGAASGSRKRAAAARRRPGLSLVPELTGPLSELDVAIRKARGSPSALGSVAEAAFLAAEGMAEQGAQVTGRCFLDAAISLQPEEPRYVHAVAVNERRHGRHAEAARCFTHAAWLGHRARRPRDVAAALLGLAATVQEQEHHAHAARLLGVAARYARLRSAPDAEADALLALGELRHTLGYVDEARGYFTDAVYAYAGNRAGIVRAGLVITRCWLQEREFVGCAKLAQTILPHLSDSITRMTVAARLARASAAIDCECWFEEAWGATFRFMGQSAGRATAEALLDLARAAGTYGMWTRAFVAAEGALERARSVGDPVLLGQAARIMAVASLPVIPHDAAREVFPDLPEELDEPGAGCSDELVLKPHTEPLFTAFAASLQARDSARG